LPRGAVERVIFETLKEQNVSQELINSLRRGFERINYVKFSSTNIDSVNIKEDIDMITALLQELMSELNKKKSMRGVK